MKKKERADRLSEQFQDAYSFNAYGEKGWKGAIKVLMSYGMSDLEIEAFMRSKHTRWAGDCDNKRRYGYFNGQTIREYLNGHPLEQNELDDLVIGTFGSLTPKG